jgi:hypothetical protein
MVTSAVKFASKVGWLGSILSKGMLKAVAAFRGPLPAKYIFLSESLSDCLEVGRSESQGGQIPKCTGLMQWPSTGSGSTGAKPECLQEDW